MRAPFDQRVATFAVAFACALGCASGGSYGIDAVDAINGPGRDAEDGPSAREYAPYGVGAQWTYEMSAGRQARRGQMVIRVVDKVDGFFRDSAGGEYRHTAGGLRDRRRYLLQNPIVAGHRWKAIVSTAAVQYFTVESVGQPCEVAFGSFADCVVVTTFERRSAQEIQHARYTWIRDVGLGEVLFEGEVKGRGRFLQQRMSLLDYRLPGLDGRRPGPRSPPAGESDAPKQWNR